MKNPSIHAFKNSDFSVEGSPVSKVQVEETFINHIVGGANSAGLFCTISGECNGSGQSCYTFGGIGDQMDYNFNLYWN